MAHFNCPTCGNKIQVGANVPGRERRCRNCGATVKEPQVKVPSIFDTGNYSADDFLKDLEEEKRKSGGGGQEQVIKIRDKEDAEAYQNERRAEVERQRQQDRAQRRLRACPDCGNSVSISAVFCPHCGCPFSLPTDTGEPRPAVEQIARGNKSSSGCLAVILLILLVPCIGSFFTSGGPKEQKQHAKRMNVRVTSQIVKRVGDRYRYFFDIRNLDALPFDGHVKITLLNNQPGVINGEETFSTNGAVPEGLGKSVYVDATTGPILVHRDWGVAGFRYEVTTAEGIVASGEGTINAKYEDVSP